MPELKRLVNAMNLHIEENKTIIKVKDGIKSTIKCNNKPIITNIASSDRLVINKKYLIFNTQSKIIDCSYLFLEKSMHKVLSSKINFIVYHLLQLIQNPELYNQIKSQKLKQLIAKIIRGNFDDFSNDNDLLNKWSKINKKISEKSLQDGLISLNRKTGQVCIQDIKIIQHYRVDDPSKYTFTYFNSYISISFPIYNLLKEKTNMLVGEKLEKHEIEILSAIYQFIFEDIDKKNAYSLLDAPLLTDIVETIDNKKILIEPSE